MTASSTQASRISAIGKPRLPVIVTLACGVVFSLAVYWVLQTRQHKEVGEAFRLAAEDRALAVKTAFETELAMMEIVRSALVTDGRIERQEFREILAPFLSRSNDIRAVEWVPRVPDSRRAEYEEAARREGIERFQINEVNAAGESVAAPRRDEYFPIYFIGPQQGNDVAYGYDLASEPSRWEALQMARDTGKTIASARISFVHDIQSTGGFFVCLPVYEKDKPVKELADRRKYLMGFVLGVFRPSDMIESALCGLQPEGIEVGLFDPSNSVDNRSLIYHASRLRDNTAPSNPNRLLDSEGMRFLVELDVAGHRWTIVCAPTPEFEAAHGSLWAHAALVVGLILTVMVAGTLWMSLEHASHLEERVHEQTADIRNAQEEVMLRLASASQWSDEETPMHIRRMGLLSEALARGADWFGSDAEAIRQAAPMHDIGKIGIPDAILRKTAPLTSAEFEVLKTHTRIGADILAGSNVPMLKMAREIAASHHERWDGKGYPKGLAGNDIPESARIVAIVDAYDSLTHDGPNRTALAEREALSAMQDESEKQFDPQLLASFFRRLPEIRRIAEQHPDKVRGKRPPPVAAVPWVSNPDTAPAQSSTPQHS